MARMFFYNPAGVRFEYSHAGLMAPHVQLALNGYTVTVSAGALLKWKYQDALVQDCFPELSPTDREFLITGLSPEQQDDFFHGETE